ncbi:MAG TPA: heme-binding domain-containing protein [Terriglobales bacterium]|nr:heme-binding domain-containing protein [Terriglobales bacterium]
MKKLLPRALMVLGFLFVVAQLIRPERTNPASDPARAVHARLAVPAEVSAVFERACRDCHSNQTRWPWYSHVAPVSWLVVDDVNHGRRHVNLSEWASYGHTEADEILDEICEEISDGGMPLRSYRWMHPEARLSQADVRLLCDWSRKQRQRLAESVAQPPAKGETPPTAD